MTAFICPLCQGHFTKTDKTQICANNHHFDIAKEGYLNLLPANAKNSKNPGDNKEMMMARRAFLNSEGYLPLAEKLSLLVKQLLAKTDEPKLLDLGCGEGYYSDFLQQSLPASAIISALDISKIAVRYAAKRYQNIQFCVASAYNIPLEDNSLDAIVRIYAPSLESELQRLIKMDGYFVTVTPAPLHLLELREHIYVEVNEHVSENPAPNGFIKLDQHQLSYPLQITEPQILKDLIQMTPFAWKFNDQKMRTLLAEKKWTITCDFNIETYQKRQQ